MLNETLESDRAYQKDIHNAYQRGYEQGKKDAQQRWIPCSERLPEVKQKVLVQYADGSMMTKRCNDAGHLQWFYANAVAWIPAPEPYHQKGDVK